MLTKSIIFENLGKIWREGEAWSIWQVFGLDFVQTGSPSYIALQHNLCNATFEA